MYTSVATTEIFIYNRLFPVFYYSIFNEFQLIFVFSAYMSVILSKEGKGGGGVNEACEDLQGYSTSPNTLQ